MTWETVPFDEVFADVTSASPRVQQRSFSEFGKYPVIDQGASEVAGYLDDESMVTRISRPLVLFGDHTRRVKYVDRDFVMGADGVKALRSAGTLFPRFAFHWLRYLDIPSAGYSRHFKFLRGRRVPLPPLPEQRRIAAILDEADALRITTRIRIRSLQDLSHARYGEILTKLPLTRTLGTLLARIDGGVSPVCEARPATDGEWGVLKLGAVTTGRYLPTENKAVGADHEPRPDLEVQVGDVLLSRKNTLEHVGASVFVNETPARRLLPDLIFRLVPHDDSIARALQVFLALSTTRRVLSNLAGGSASSMANISKARLRTLPTPSLSPEVVEEIDAIANEADAQLVASRRSSTAADALFTSLQHRAFRGEL